MSLSSLTIIELKLHIIVRLLMSQFFLRNVLVLLVLLPNFLSLYLRFSCIFFGGEIITINLSMRRPAAREGSTLSLC